MNAADIVIKKSAPLKARWGEPYEESDNLNYILKTAIMMTGIGFEVYLQRLNKKHAEYPFYKFRLFISKP
jgi:hypothetical protein